MMNELQILLVHEIDSVNENYLIGTLITDGYLAEFTNSGWIRKFFVPFIGSLTLSNE